MKVVVTGVCGFIGFNLLNYLLKKNIKVYGIDNLIITILLNINERLKYLKNSKILSFIKLMFQNTIS